MTDHIHSCGHHCDRPACIKHDRDTIVARFGRVTPYVERLERDISNERIVTTEIIRQYMQDEIDELRACFS